MQGHVMFSIDILASVIIALADLFSENPEVSFKYGSELCSITFGPKAGQAPIEKLTVSKISLWGGKIHTVTSQYIPRNEVENPDANKEFKYKRYSFNVKGGRCEACEGDGVIKIEEPKTFQLCGGSAFYRNR